MSIHTTTVECPKCGRYNSPNSYNCYGCGYPTAALFTKDRDAFQKAVEEFSNPTPRTRTVYFTYKEDGSRSDEDEITRKDKVRVEEQARLIAKAQREADARKRADEARRITAEKIAQAKMTSHYAILELETTATQIEIQDAYRFLSVVWHPDRFPQDTEAWKRANERMKSIRDLRINHSSTLTERLKSLPQRRESGLRGLEDSISRASLNAAYSALRKRI